MLPSSHQIAIRTELPQPSPSPAQTMMLAEAFSEFISASARLESSYRELQVEVAELSQKLAERNQALHESLSENRDMGLALERIVEAMPCGVLVVSREGFVRLANPEAVRLLALSPALLPDLHAVKADEGLQLVLGDAVAHESQPEQEVLLQRDGKEVWLAVRRVFLHERGGDEKSMRAGEMVLTLRNITERKQTEKQREAARDAVALAQVSALLAHEIRNPLASLELFAGLIADSPERRDEWLSHLRAGIRSLSGTVNNVLALHNGAMPAMERLEVGVEAALAVDFLRPLAQQANVALTLQACAHKHYVRANKSALQQLLLNLCSNALRHTPAGGRVCVQYESYGEGDTRQLRLSVVDNGCGIAKDHLPWLFEGGFSGSGNTPGLGLAVCERLMRQHGGAIRVQSQLGQGSTFTLEFAQA